MMVSCGIKVQGDLIMSGKKVRVAVVGGGAAGMIAAIAARRKGAEVTILERGPRIGKKILATGNGRCNFTNIYTAIEHYYGSNPKFVASSLGQFSVEKTLDFFERLGIAPRIEDQGKVYPRSEQASSILDVLLYELKELGVQICGDSCVIKISKEEKLFSIALVNGTRFNFERIIISCGGKAKPSTGSDGSGYELAQMLGHTVTEVFPALVQLKLEGQYFKQLEGVKFVGTAQLLGHNKIVTQDQGDILFANYGVSGPPILQLSRKAGELLHKGQEPVLKIILIDHMKEEELQQVMIKRFNDGPHKTVQFSLVGLINKRLISVVLKEAGITDLNRPVSTITRQERQRIVSILTDWRFKIKGTKSWPSAQVTAGGISTEEINPATMESRLVSGLYFAGEIIDIDGQCGGFNLQWAWSSGFVAGQNAAY